MVDPNKLVVAVAQISPVWLNRSATIEKVVSAIEEAARKGAEFVAFGGEVLIPGYIFWIERTGGATFGDPDQKNMHRHYVQQAVCIETGMDWSRTVSVHLRLERSIAGKTGCRLPAPRCTRKAKTCTSRFGRAAIT